MSLPHERRELIFQQFGGPCAVVLLFPHEGYQYKGQNAVVKPTSEECLIDGQAP